MPIAMIGVGSSDPGRDPVLPKKYFISLSIIDVLKKHLAIPIQALFQSSKSKGVAMSQSH